MAKNLFVLTVPTTITIATEASDEKDAVEKAKTAIKSVLGASFGVISIVGDPKVIPVSAAKSSKKEDDEEEEDDEEDEPKKSDKKSDKKTDKKSDKKPEGKKIKIKLKG